MSLQTAPESQFDFWVGNWNCTGKSLGPNGEWTETKAQNRIEKTLDNKVVQENFKMDAFEGRSWSVYNPQAKRWSQTWVDNQGGYIALSGTFADGKMTLVTLPNPAQPQSFARMVFSDIKADSFTWHWEKSSDGGKTWTLQWELEYKRK